MKHLSSSSGPASRFKGGSRRAYNPKDRRLAWDQWIDGGAKSSLPITKWLKILGILALLIALGGIIVGLALVLGHN